VYYKCVKFHKNLISDLGGVALTRYMDGRTGWFLYTPQTLFAGGIITNTSIQQNFKLKCAVNLLLPALKYLTILSDSSEVGAPSLWAFFSECLLVGMSPTCTHTWNIT
jgi:hypothetical protein